METSLSVIMALIGSLCFGVVFQVPRRVLPITILIGFLSIYTLQHMPERWDASLSTFFVALFIGCLCNFIGRFSRTPAQGLLIPGVIFLVPGAKVYRSFTTALSGNMDEAVSLLVSAMLVTVAISFGLLIATWIVPVRKLL